MNLDEWLIIEDQKYFKNWLSNHKVLKNISKIKSSDIFYFYLNLDNDPSYEIDPNFHNLQAEQTLLGTFLLNNGTLKHVSDFLTGGHFADRIHGRIYDAMISLVNRGQIADPITLKKFFTKDKGLEPVGGADYLIHLANAIDSIIDVAYFANLIRNHYFQRLGGQIKFEIKKSIIAIEYGPLILIAPMYIENYNNPFAKDLENKIIDFTSFKQCKKFENSLKNLPY